MRTPPIPPDDADADSGASSGNGNGNGNGEERTEVWTAHFRARTMVGRDQTLFKNYTTPRSILEGMGGTGTSTTSNSGSSGSSSSGGKSSSSGGAVSASLLASNAAALAANAAAVGAAIQSSAANQGHLPLAACLVIPYTSTDTQKSTANGAMLLEWLRYHAQLGFKIIVYDRDGANEKHIYESVYGASQRIRVPKVGRGV